jgi:hypothetical protein
MASVPHMLKNGLIGIKPHETKRSESIKNMMERAEKLSSARS